MANERYSYSDERGCKFSARFMLVYIVFGLLLRDRMPGAGPPTLLTRAGMGAARASPHVYAWHQCSMRSRALRRSASSNVAHPARCQPESTRARIVHVYTCVWPPPHACALCTPCATQPPARIRRLCARAGMAALHLVHAALAEGLASWVIPRRRALFVAHREVVVTLLQAHHAWTLIYTSGCSVVVG